jgi:hypothetical protein
VSLIFYRAAGVERAPYEYNIAAWEARNFPNKWLYAFGQLFRDAPSREEEDSAITRYLQLNREIEVLERETSSQARRGEPTDEAKTLSLVAKTKERNGLENEVEATLESRLSEAIDGLGLDSSLLFTDAVWPPVDAEFTRAPSTLAVSPRDHIELKSSDLLREDLTLAETEKIEEETEQRSNVSALAFPTSGVGAYPTIVDFPTDYREALTVIGHEWTHNYLFFHPLGFNYYKNNDLRTMNETVADLVGKELADAVMAAWPLSATAPPAIQSPQQPEVDVGSELRILRGEVDGLLAQGKVSEAEALMEQRRQELLARGVYIRKINQAYFAFTNLYAGEAGSPAATSTIGPKIDDLRRSSASLADFVHTVSGLTSVQQLDRALANGQ